MVNLGDIFPDFDAKTTEGDFKFHEFLQDSWCILFSHPRDYTPVCTTELGAVLKLVPEFQKRNTKLIALSCDDVDSHQGWAQDVISFAGQTGKLPYPIIADPSRELAVKFGMVDPDEQDDKGMPLTCRAVFIIGPDKKLKLAILYPATTGRNFDEILRVIDSLQLTAYKKVATPANWKKGEECMVIPSLTDADANKLFPKGFRKQDVPSGKGYLRFTADPSDPPK
jgi:1-Cys peroxiredoxin 6